MQPGNWPDTEEPADQFLHRPLARPLVALLLKTRVTPNQVTAFSGIFGVASAVVMLQAVAAPAYRVVGSVFLLGAIILDCVDGQLARARGQQSHLGRILDGLTDTLVGAAAMIGVTYLAAPHENGVWLLGAFATVSLAAHTWIFDAVKTQYKILAGLSLPEPERPVGQRSLDLVYSLFRWFGSLGTAPIAARDPIQFRRHNRFRMRLWTLLGPGCHFFCLYTAAALSAVWPDSAFVCLIVFVLVMNVLFIGLLATKWVNPD
jgi:phosphatidylglycerophosphate synthase